MTLPGIPVRADRGDSLLGAIEGSAEIADDQFDVALELLEHRAAMFEDWSSRQVLESFLGDEHVVDRKFARDFIKEPAEWEQVFWH